MAQGKARLVYLIKEWGNEKYINETNKLLEDQLVDFDFPDPLYTDLIEEQIKPIVPHAHIEDMNKPRRA